MKKSFSESAAGKFLLGKGFYVALAVCVLGAGAAAWVIVDKTIDSLTNEPQNPETVLQQPSQSSREESLNLVDRAVSDISIPEQNSSRAQSSVSSSGSSSSSKPDSSSSASSKDFTQQTISPDYTNPSYMLPIDSTVFGLFSGTELVKDATLDKWQTHNGIDIRGEVGQPVRAATDGVVSSVKTDPMWGVVVEIRHGEDLISRYCGLDENLPVQEGEPVSIADVIGYLGETNLAETALEPHLHFELFKDGKRVDPLSYMGFYDSND